MKKKHIRDMIANEKAGDVMDTENRKALKKTRDSENSAWDSKASVYTGLQHFY